MVIVKLIFFGTEQHINVVLSFEMKTSKSLYALHVDDELQRLSFIECNVSAQILNPQGILNSI